MRACTVVLLACLLGSRAALAAGEFPERPIALIAPFPAGGAVDVVARGLAEAARKHLPKPVVVVNRPGGAGTIGMAEVVQAKPDGYTIGLSAVAVATVQPHLTPLPYRTPDDYTPILKLVTLPIIVFVRTDAPFTSAADLLEHARANPGKLRVGVPGIGTILHLDLERLKRMARVDLTVVPFEGPHQIPALLGGHVDLAMAHAAPVLPHVSAGRIRVIGVFQEARHPRFPDAPTFKELGYDITLGVYYFLVAPKGTPAPVVATLHDVFRRALADPAFVALAEKSQFDIDYRPGEAVTRELWASFETLGQLVQQLGLKKP
jgi:tripartite-type tricarboxylate transporter receptor subunit TctC